jgi:hypothetical protein
MKKLTCLLASGFIISGCGTPPPAVPDGPEATPLEIVNASPEVPLTFAVFDSDNNCYGQRLLTFGATNFSGTRTNVRIRKHQTFNFQYLGVRVAATGLMSRTCGGYYTFATDGPGPYRITVKNSDRECFVDAARLTERGFVPTVLIPREKSRPMWDNAGPWCTPDSRF